MEATHLSPGNDSRASSTSAERPLAPRIGVALMATSFLVYVVYGILPFLPLDASVLAGIGIGSSLASWGLFSLGAALVGRDAAALFRAAVRRLWRRLGRGDRA